MRQERFGQLEGSERFARKSERQLFLDRMEQVATWGELLALAEPQVGPEGAPQFPAGLSILLRTYLIQRWFNLSDAGAEEALYDSPVLRRFAGVDLSLAAAPGEPEIRDFRQQLEERGLAVRIMAIVNGYLDERGIRVTSGANLGLMLVDAPSLPGNGPDGHDLQMNKPGDGPRRRAGSRAKASAYSGSYSMDPETAASEARERSAGLTGAREMDIANAAFSATDTLSVAVISADKQRRNAATTALGQCHRGPIREFLSYPPNLDEVARTLNRDFDVVIVDLDSDPEYALNLVKSISASPMATVMVYSAQSNPDLLLQCMRAGAREFLTLPFGPGIMADALLRASTLRAASRPARKPDGRLLVFLSAKGGSGVTTLACNFAVSLAQESGQKTLLIDLNLPLGDVGINLGIRAEHSVVSVLQNFKRLDAMFLSGLLESHSSGLSVLAAPSQLAPTDVSNEAIDKLLEVACQGFDYVVVDAGSKLDLLTTRLFDESATLYLVTQVGIAELRNSNRLISRLSAAGSPKLEIVLNRYDPHSLEIAEEHITKALTRPAEWKIPNNYAAVRRMQNTATSLMQDDSEIARAIRQMARAASGQPLLTEKKKRFTFFR